MQTPTGAQEVPGVVPESTPPPTTSKSKRNKKLVIQSGDQPSTDPTRLRSSNGQPPSSLKKPRREGRKEKTPAFSNPLDVQAQQQEGAINATGGSNPSQLEQPRRQANVVALGSVGSSNTGTSSWGDQRAEIRSSSFNTMVVRRPERLLLALVALPCVLTIVFFAVNWTSLSARRVVSEVPAGIEVVKEGANVIHHLLREQYFAQELQNFHVTASQQAFLQNEAQTYYPYYPQVDTSSYYLSSMNFVEAIVKTDEARKRLWLAYLKGKDQLAYKFTYFDEVLLEKTRGLVRSGHMDFTDQNYELISTDLLRYIERIWFLGGMTPAWQDMSLPLRVTGMIGRGAALEAVALFVEEGNQLDGNTSTLTIDGGNSGMHKFLHETALADAYRVRLLAGFVPEEGLNAQFQKSTRQFIHKTERAVNHSELDSEVWTDNSQSLRVVGYEMLGQIEATSAVSFEKMSQKSAEARIVEATWDLLLVAFVCACCCLLGVSAMVFSTKTNWAQDKEIRDMEKAMDRMKLFVKQVSDFDIAPLSSTVPRSAPQQELMLRQYMTPMKELVDFIPSTLTYPPLAIPDSQLTPEGLWLKSDEFCFVNSLAVVRIDITGFHSQFHCAGAKQRTVQHQSQAVLSSLHAIASAFGVQLNVFTDHVMCYVNLCDEMTDPAAVALSIGFQVRQMCEERKIPMLRCAIAMGSAYCGMASTKGLRNTENCAAVTHLAVTGSVIAETEALCSGSAIHSVDLICTEKVMSELREMRGGHVDLFSSYANAMTLEGEQEEAAPGASTIRTRDVPHLQQEDVEFRPLELLRLDPKDGFETPQKTGKKATNAPMESTVLYEIHSTKLSNARESIAGASTDRNPMSIEWKVAFSAFRNAMISKENMLNALGLLMEFEHRYPKDPSALRLLSILVKIHEQNEDGVRVGAERKKTIATGQDELRQQSVLSYMCGSTVS